MNEGRRDHGRAMEAWQLRALKTWTLIGVAVLVVALLWLMARMWSILTPFVFAALVVFLLRRPVAFLADRGVSRGLGVLVCYGGIFAALGFFLVAVLPPLVREFVQFLDDFPGYFAAARDLWVRLQTEYTSLEVPSWAQEALLSTRDDIARQATIWSRALAGGIVLAGGQLAGFLLGTFLALTLAFFTLRDLPVIKQELLRLGGVRRREEMLELFVRITTVIEGWLKGQTLIAFIVGVLTWAGLQLLGVPYALIIGIIAGVTNLIPYLGPIVGGTVAAVSAAFVSPMLVVWTVLYIVVLQQLESMFLQPRVMSDQVNLHPVLVVFSLLVGASVGGLVGMLLALPVAGAINAAFVYYFEKHTDSELATPDGALFRRLECEDDADDCEEAPEPSSPEHDEETE